MNVADPYLNFDGNTEEAFTFYKSVFGGEFKVLLRFRDFRDNAMGVAEADLDKIAHISLPLGPHNTLMATDHLESFPQELKRGNDFAITLHPESLEEAERLFEGLSAGGRVKMPLEKTEWAEKYGECIDSFGVRWIMNYTGNVSLPGDQDG